MIANILGAFNGRIPHRPGKPIWDVVATPNACWLGRNVPSGSHQNAIDCIMKAVGKFKTILPTRRRALLTRLCFAVHGIMVSPGTRWSDEAMLSRADVVRIRTPPYFFGGNMSDLLSQPLV